jgi:hypothetical protein
MDEKIQKLKSYVVEASKNPSFLHHDWFVEYHLNIFEKIALELCDIYKEADKDVVLTLVWIHDYGKILDMAREHELNHKAGELLVELDFPTDFVKKVMEYLEIFESKMTTDLSKAPIEVQIASSSDAASHMVGPFMPIYWKEYNSKSIKELMGEQIKKLTKDWERKIVLPEVKVAFKERRKFISEQAGNLPDKFF